MNAFPVVPNKDITIYKAPRQDRVRLAILFTVTTIAITALVFCGRCHFNKALYNITLKQFFSTNLALKASLVSVIGFSILTLPIFIARTLDYKNGRLSLENLKKGQEARKAAAEAKLAKAQAEVAAEARDAVAARDLTPKERAVQLAQAELDALDVERDIQTLLEALAEKNGSRFTIDHWLKNKITAMQGNGSAKVKRMLEELAKGIIDDPYADPAKVIERIAAFIQVTVEYATPAEAAGARENLARDAEAAIPQLFDFIDFNNQEQKQLLIETAKHHLAQSRKNIDSSSLSPQERVSRSLNSLLSVIGSIISIIGIADLFQPSNDEGHAGFKAQKILVLVNICTILATVLVPVLGGAQAGGIVVGFLGTLILLSIIWPKVKPLPDAMPANGKNINIQIENGEIPTYGGRGELCERICRVLAAGQNVLLIGPSRGGKTVTAYEVARYMMTNPDCPSQLKKNMLYMFNTNELAKRKPGFIGGSSNILPGIEEAMGRHGRTPETIGKATLILDEFHVAATGDGEFAEAFKTANLPPTIAITTQKEYDAHIKPNLALDKRFVKIEIESTDPEVTKQILYALLATSYPTIECDEETINHLVRTLAEDKNLVQPFESIQIFERVIRDFITSTKSNVEMKELKKSHNELVSKRTTLLNTQKTRKGDIQNIAKELQQLNRDISIKKAAIDLLQAQFNELERTKVLLDKIRKAKYETSLLFEKESTNTSFAQNHFHLLSYFEGIMKKEIATQSEKLKIKSKIDIELITSAIKQKKTEDDKDNKAAKEEAERKKIDTEQEFVKTQIRQEMLREILEGPVKEELSKELRAAEEANRQPARAEAEEYKE